MASALVEKNCEGKEERNCLLPVGPLDRPSLPGSPYALHLRSCSPTAQSRSVGGGLGRRLQLVTTGEKQLDIRASLVSQLLWV